ncbi:MAG: glycosyltransferase family 4 protein [Aridibacter famidurans]|nr:glycosyltransferase family 4 protein [Aridibacter famidurans]
MNNPIRVLCLASYPIEAAATRYRVDQFIEPLSKLGIAVDLVPSLTGPQFSSLYQNGSSLKKAAYAVQATLRRISGLARAGNYDVLFVQREAMFFGPAVFEWAYRSIGDLPLVLDLDDATYVSYTSPRFGKIGSALKFFGKTNKLISAAEVVVCGNRFIAEHVRSKGTKPVVIPTVVDTERFRPSTLENEVPVIGWIGTHSTYPSLESLLPVIEKLGSKHRFRFLVVGAGRSEVTVPGIEVESLDWKLSREIGDFQRLDIGLYPIKTSSSANIEWIKGKSGFKAIQYMAVGVPFVMSPVGVCGELGVDGETHFNATSDEDWYNSIDKLLSDPSLRRRMGKNARNYATEHFTLEEQARKLSEVLVQVAGRRS